MNYRRINILGLHISCTRESEILQEIQQCILQGRKLTIACANAHYANQAHDDPWLKDYLNSIEVLHPDGIGIYLASKLLFGQSGLPARMTGTDLYFRILEIANARAWRLFLLGETDPIVEKAVRRVKNQFPNVRIAGAHHGYFDIDDETQVKLIGELNPDILLVGLGMPKQELWLRRHRERLKVPVCIAVGGGIAHIARRFPRAPEFLMRLGLEWLFRLMLEPRRLWKRYLVGIPVFILHVLRQRIEQTR